jgi:hypothetical protein
VLRRVGKGGSTGGRKYPLTLESEGERVCGFTQKGGEMRFDPKDSSSLSTLEAYATVQCGIRVSDFSLEAWSLFIREGWADDRGGMEELRRLAVFREHCLDEKPEEAR